ncbi:MAG: PQQ-dependent sugar dehydrogenase, partial [Pelagibacterales bacterium]|nr:PQQ-dependent sugar dehydrogenase [Pelagibacterales bacterium]
MADSHSKGYKLETIVDGLDHPWGVTFISNEEILVTELSGQLRVVKDGVLLKEPIQGVPDVLFAGQGGLSEVILHPDFKENSYICLSCSESDASNKKFNTLRVSRANFLGSSLKDLKK